MAHSRSAARQLGVHGKIMDHRVERAVHPYKVSAMSRSTLVVLMRFGVSALLLSVLIYKIDFSDALSRISGINPVFLVTAGGLVIVQVFLNSRRWLSVLKPLGGHLSYLTTVRIYFVGFFFDQYLPTSVGGDAMRIYLARRTGLPLEISVNSVLLERILILVALVIILLAIQPVLYPILPLSVRELQIGALAAMSTALALLLLVLTNLHRFPRFERVQWLTNWLSDTATHARRLVFHPRTSLQALAIAFICHLNNVTIVYVLQIGLGIELTYFQTVYLYLPVILFLVMPISIAGWGVREGAFVLLYGIEGVPSDSALALSVMVGLLLIATSLPGGVIWLIGGRNPRETSTS